MIALPLPDGLADLNLRQMPVPVLAYIGDAYYELQIRLALAARYQGDSGRLHRRCVRLVRAVAQATALDLLRPALTGEETDLVHRARNHHPVSMPRHADQAAYREATAFEALVGWLLLAGQTERLDNLITQVLEALHYGEQSGPTGRS